MRRCLGLTIVASICTLPLMGQSEVVKFYPTAIAAAEHPPPLRSLTILCEAKVEFHGDRGWLTFVGPAGAEAILVVVGPKVDKLGEKVSLTVMGDPPSGRPEPNGTLDWSYIWDRNGDGRVDYLAYLDGALFVLPDPVPADLPTVVKASGVQVSSYFGWSDRPPPADKAERSKEFPRWLKGPFGLLEVHRDAWPILMRQVTMIFHHFADDNFDGLAEAVVLPEVDMERPIMVGKRTVFFSAGRNGTIDAAWSFRRVITDTLSVPDPAGERFWMSPATVRPEPVRTQFQRGQRLFELIQLGVRGCGGKLRLRRE